MSARRQVGILNWSRPLTLNLLGRSRVDLALLSVWRMCRSDASARVSYPGLNFSPMDTVIKHCILFTLLLACLEQKLTFPPPIMDREERDAQTETDFKQKQLILFTIWHY